MPKFQRPNLPNLENAPEAAGLNALGQTIQTIPQLYAQYKQQKMQQELKNRELEMQLKQNEALYGTGAPAPTAPLTGSGPLDIQSPFTMPNNQATLPESNEDKLKRVGIMGFNALKEKDKTKTNVLKSEVLKNPGKYKDVADLNVIDDSKANQLDFRQDERVIKLIDKFNADPNVRKEMASIDSVGKIKELLNSNNPIADGSIPTFMARASGEVGNLSESDKAPFGGSQALKARIKAVAKKLESGEMTEENRQFIYQLAEVMEKAANRNIVEIAKTRAKQYSQTSVGMNDKQIFQLLVPEAEMPSSTPTPSSGPSQPAASAPKIGDKFGNGTIKKVTRIE